jgi:hypothetical protein
MLAASRWAGRIEWAFYSRRGDAMPEETFRSLPCVGAQLVKLSFCGNGKRSEVTLQANRHQQRVAPH